MEIFNSLDKDIEEKLREWYLEVIKSNYQYVVFATKRSYIIANILEDETRKLMKDTTSKKYLTGASIVMHCDDMVNYYKKVGVLPNILLCDDILLHGRNINHVITSLQNRLAELLPEKRIADINNALSDAINIHTFAKLDDRLLLLLLYLDKVDYKYLGSLASINQISNDLSFLISNSNIANETNIFSEKITKEQFERINKKNLVYTKYQNIEQYSQIDIIGSNEVKAIFTIRMLKKSDETYRVIPHVFLPNLDAFETKEIATYLYNKMSKKQYNKEMTDYIFGEFMNINKKQNFNEFLSFVFSYVLLNDFNKKYNINNIDNDDKRAEIEKIVRNYNFSNHEFWKKNILDLIKHPLIESTNELIEIIESNLSESRHLGRINDTVENKQNDNIKNELENYFYMQGCKDEMQAFSMKKKNFPIFEDRAIPSIENCDNLISALVKRYNSHDIKISISYFLQFMDTGILSLSSEPSKKINVEGYSQFIKADSQALSIYPLRMDKYMRFLDYIQEICELYNVKIDDQIENFSQSKYCKLTKEEIDEIQNFVGILNVIGHTTRDWNCHYLNRLDVYSKTTKEVVNYYNEKDNYQEDCKQYCKKYIKNKL